MSTAAIDLAAPAPVTFATILDAQAYPQWLVGAKRIRRVEPHWPSPGSSFHHAIGFGPLTVRDRTTVLANDGVGHFVLRARIRHVAAMRISFTVTARGDGESHLAMEEEVVDASAVWCNPLTQPLVGIALWGRNAVSLQELRALVEDRARA